MNVNQTAFCTVTLLGAATIGSTILAATTTSTVAMVACAILAALGSALSIASMTAYAAMKGNPEKEDTASAYFQEITNHAGYSIAAVTQFIAHNLIGALIDGLCRGIAGRVERKITG